MLLLSVHTLQTQRDISPSDAGYLSWFTRVLREHVERLLGPLLISTHLQTGQDFTSYAYAQDGYIANDPVPEPMKLLPFFRGTSMCALR